MELTWPAPLAPQAFAGTPLDRSAAGDSAKDSGFLRKCASEGARVLPVLEGGVLSGTFDGKKKRELFWLNLDELPLAPWGLGAASLSNDAQEEVSKDELELYLLGRSPEGMWCFAVDVSARAAEVKATASAQGLQHLPVLTLLFMRMLSDSDLAIAGHAAALVRWHAGMRFCGRCGSRTRAVEGGLKRQCKEPRHKLYPRTDPVVLALVTSKDGQRCLLGHSKGLPPGMFTALAGFCELSEGVEEAVRREVMEEAGVRCGRVTIVGSQPWPLGRAGACELTCGCLAVAETEEIVPNAELEDVRWFDRETAAQMLARSRERRPPPGELCVPGDFALAHHLVQRWLEQPPPISSKQ
mmetsp:Transcript_21833/g.70516  ORF Transcript_21833/g.70516 Transcript_21833/m.70516 type:complete len:354 (+) Transcript_21833:97-1158(+)|eukprot:CAMPEP_0170145764 /NCGR_PEP_ID=MMETSP0033_2-20121228/25477_1 /TAXON_ID=195969 /ORGANISM="Dolichomastix tenuilepis, Strain CCMP3274" /LENGTH=353 /DNA_ID=CAMNT_0010382393 /DNA_START=86 /DNA_END=1147 /DNA_ORIENTATION=+